MPIPAMRRKERQLTDEQTLRILSTGKLGVLSTVDEEGQPYGVPLNYVYQQGAIYFHCAPEGYKLLNLGANPRVSFCVVQQSELIPQSFSTDYASAIVFGTAAQVDGAEKEEALRLLIGHLAPGHEEKGEKYIQSQAQQTAVVRIEIQHQTGKARAKP
jgi:nitroimidazol reductase NimA-like FMN-containing flavoprotein (pyridoxamine 5'-phosphate oxidase superfamily)